MQDRPQIRSEFRVRTDRDTSTDDGTAPPLVPSHVGHPLSLLAPDAEHLVWFQCAGDETILLAVILFGRTMFGVPVHHGPSNLPKLAWRLDWRTGTVAETTWDGLMLHAVTNMPEDDLSDAG